MVDGVTRESFDVAIRPEEATADETMGMAWWNALSEQLRAYWLKRTSNPNGSAADAWEAFKTARDSTEKWASLGPVRSHNGLEFPGFEMSLKVLPGDDGLLGVLVIAESPATGFERACSLGDESTGHLRFGLDANIGEKTLVWFATNQYASLFMEGIKVVLQPYQCELLRANLPRLGRTAALSKELASALERQLDAEAPKLHYLNDLCSGLAARVILDQEAPGVAIEGVIAEHWAAKEPGVTEAVSSDTVLKLVENFLQVGQTL